MGVGSKLASATALPRRLLACGTPTPVAETKPEAPPKVPQHEKCVAHPSTVDSLPSLLQCQPSLRSLDVDSEMSPMKRRRDHLTKGGSPTLLSVDAAMTEDESAVPAFVNIMLKHMWPAISDYTKEIISNIVQPAIRRAMESLGSLGSNFGFDIQSLDLGSRPIRFSEMWAHRAVQASDGGDLDNVVVRGTLEWEGDIAVRTRFGRIPVGIKAVSLTGTLVIECVGMMPTPPMFQGVRVFFINPPNVNITFQGRLTKLLNQGTVKRNILRVVGEQLAKRLVVPNRMGFQLDQKAEYFRILQPRPAGILRLSVIRAEELLPMDRHLFSPASSDPYVVVRCGAEVFRSQTVKRTVAPVFNFDVQLQIASLRHQKVRIELWDEDKFKQDDFLGALDLSVLKMISWGGREVTIGIQDEAGNKGARGKAFLWAQWHPLLLDSEKTSTEDAGLVFAGLYSASGVPWEGDGTRFWVKASCNNILPGSSSEHQGALTSPQIVQEQAVDDVLRDMVATRIRRKVELMQKYNVQAEDMAELLEVDPGTLKSRVLNQGAIKEDCSFQALQATSRHTLKFNHAYEFLIERPGSTIATFEMWSQMPTQHAKVLGRCAINVRDLMNIPDHTLLKAVPLDGTDIVLKLRLQLRFLGSRRVLC